jgi:hypothetical protein
VDRGRRSLLPGAKGKKPFLSDGRYLRAKGYEITDEALGFALFAKASKKGAALPRFTESAHEGRLSRAVKGVDLFRSPQCVFAMSIAAAKAEVIYESVLRANEGGRLYKGKIGLRDMRRLVVLAGELA